MHLSSFVGVFFFFKKWVVIVLQWGLSLKRLVYWTQLLSLKCINMLHLCYISCVKGKLQYYYSIYSVKSLPKWGARRGLFVPFFKAIFNTWYLLRESRGLMWFSNCCSSPKFSLLLFGWVWRTALHAWEASFLTRQSHVLTSLRESHMPGHLSQPLMPPRYVAGLEEPLSNFLSCHFAVLKSYLSSMQRWADYRSRDSYVFLSRNK